MAILHIDTIRALGEEELEKGRQDVVREGIVEQSVPKPVHGVVIVLTGTILIMEIQILIIVFLTKKYKIIRSFLVLVG